MIFNKPEIRTQEQFRKFEIRQQNDQDFLEKDLAVLKAPIKFDSKQPMNPASADFLFYRPSDTHRGIVLSPEGAVHAQTGSAGKGLEFVRTLTEAEKTSMKAFLASYLENHKADRPAWGTAWLADGEKARYVHAEEFLKKIK